MVFVVSQRDSWIADRAAQAMQALLPKPVTRALVCLTGTQVTTVASHEEPPEPRLHVVIDLDELVPAMPLRLPPSQA